MKKKAIEQVPYLGAKKHGTGAHVISAKVNEVAGEPCLFVEFYENKKKSLEVPLVRTVVTAKDWANFIPEKACWDVRQIESVCDNEKIHRGYYGKSNVCISNENENVIKEFAEKCGVNVSGYSNWYGLIRSIQNGILGARELARRQKREERMQERQVDTPKLPTGFEEWYKRILFGGVNYLYYKRKGRYADITCSHCGESYTMATKRTESFEGQLEPTIETPRDKALGVCRYCGTHALYKPKGRMDGVHGMERYCYVGQKFREKGFVIRYISITKMLQLDAPERYSVVEIARDYFEPGKKVQKDYHYYSGYSNTEGWMDHNFGGYRNISQGKAEIYPGTFRELEGTMFQYSAADEYYRRYRADGAALPWYLETYLEKPYLEMLVKMGLYKIADALAKGENYKVPLKQYAKRPDELLGIYKHKIKHLIQWGGDEDLLKVLQLEKDTDSAWTDEVCEKLATIKISKENIKTALGFMSLRKFMNRVETYAGCEWGARTICSGASARLRTIASTYVDYLNMRSQLGYDMTNTVFLYPRDLEDAHRKMTFEMNKKAGDKRLNEVKAKFPEIRKQYRALRKKYYYEDEEYIIRPAISAEEIVMEGRILHHCVGGDSYLDKHNKGESIILMLRFKDKHTIPYITVEIRDYNIVQWYGAYDKKPDKENMEKWLSQYVTRIKATAVRELLMAAG